MKTKGRLLELDCLRGFAAIFVVLFHTTLGFPAANFGFKFGCTGVELFFLISGFVIFLTIEKTSSAKDFLLSRFSRLFPAYWVCVSITALAIVSWTLLTKSPLTFPTFKDYVINLTMIQYYFGVKNIDGSYWTLTMELLFYLFILIVYLLKKLHKIEIIGYFVVLTCLLNQTFLKFNFHLVYDLLNGYLPLINYFPLFIAGIIFYRIKFYKISLSRAILLLLCFITQVLLFEHAGISPVVMTQFQYAIIVFVYFIIFLLYSYGYLHFIINNVALFLGKISYSLYLIHQYITYYLLIPLLTHSKHFHLNPNIVVFCIALPLVVVLAALINKYVEIPAMRYLRNRSRV
jgi:peptidoglycan/LPS O-acetylase OafA/YrhL